MSVPGLHVQKLVQQFSQWYSSSAKGIAKNPCLLHIIFVLFYTQLEAESTTNLMGKFYSCEILIFYLLLKEI